MRLIDADKLFNTVLEQELWNVPDFVYESIKKAPTVKAIPIEWIEKYIWGADTHEEKRVLRKMYAQWEKDNE